MGAFENFSFRSTPAPRSQQFSSSALSQAPFKLRFPRGRFALPFSEPLLAFDNTLKSQLYILRQNINLSVEKRMRSHLFWISWSPISI